MRKASSPNSKKNNASLVSFRFGLFCEWSNLIRKVFVQLSKKHIVTSTDTMSHWQLQQHQQLPPSSPQIKNKKEKKKRKKRNLSLFAAKKKRKKEKQGGGGEGKTNRRFLKSRSYGALSPLKTAASSQTEQTNKQTINYTPIWIKIVTSIEKSRMDYRI